LVNIWSTFKKNLFFGKKIILKFEMLFFARITSFERRRVAVGALFFDE